MSPPPSFTDQIQNRNRSLITYAHFFALVIMCYLVYQWFSWHISDLSSNSFFLPIFYLLYFSIMRVGEEFYETEYCFSLLLLCKKKIMIIDNTYTFSCTSCASSTLYLWFLDLSYAYFDWLCNKSVIS